MASPTRFTLLLTVPVVLLLTIFNLSVAVAQPTIDPQGDIGIGTTAPDASAIQDITSTSKGILIPRMSTAQRNTIAAPAHGLLVFNVDENEFQYYNMGTAMWIPLISSASNPLILSYSTISTGGTIPSDALVINIQSTGADAVSPSVSLPGSGTNGQMLWVTTDDPDGAIVGGFAFASNTSVRYVYAAGAWRREF